MSHELAYRMYWLPLFGDEDISTITRTEVEQLIYDLARQSKHAFYTPL